MSDKSGTPVRMEILGYSDKGFSTLSGSIEVQINPSSLKYGKQAEFSDDESIGTQEPQKNFYRYRATLLSFDFVFDETGVIPLLLGDESTTIPAMIKHLEEVVCNIDGESHQPHFLKLSWGSFLFKGRLVSLDYDYTLFRPDGSPLRVKVTLKIEGWLDSLTEARLVGRSSPDLTRLIVLADGETLALWCERIYGDSSYCADVARENDLAGFRHVEPGTRILFPPLKRSDG